MNKETLTKPIQFLDWNPDGSDFTERIIPVEPLDDNKLALLPFTERGHILKERSTTYAKPFLEASFNIPIAEVRQGTLELATTLWEVESRNWEISHYSNLAEKESLEYEEEKAAIRSGKRGKRALDKKVGNLSRNWQAKNSDIGAQIEAARTLRDTVLDGFIDSTFLTPEGVDSFLLSAQDVMEQSSISEDRIRNLLRSITERVKNISTPEEARRYNYKKHEGNLVTEFQARTLAQITELALSKNGDTPLKLELQQTSKQLLDFYWDKAEIINPKDKTARFGVIHDVLLAGSFLKKDPQIVYNAVLYFGEKINDNIEEMKNGYATLADLHYKEHFDFVDEIKRDEKKYNMSDMLDLQENDEISRTYFEKWDPEKRGAVSLGINTDRTMAFNSFSLLSRFLGGRNYTKILGNGVIRTQEESEMIVKNDDLFNLFDVVLGFRFPESVNLNAELMLLLDKKMYIEGMQELRKFRSDVTWKRPDFKLSDKESREEFIRNEFKLFGVGRGKVLMSMFFDEGLTGFESLSTMSAENKTLTDRIRNNNLWFVAEQGDQYSLGKNPELAAHSIKSITFTPKPDYQGHLVHIQTELEDVEQKPIDINLVITRDGRLTSIFGNDAPIHTWVDLPLKNFVLKRLHFITCGALGERGGHEVNEEAEEVRPTEVRRSHWRILTSTPGRKYTLQSYEAKKHAEYVKETYGIDIYEENLRRKLAGTLGKDQVLTFVKAVKGQAEPNQIVYDESKLDLLAI